MMCISRKAWTAAVLLAVAGIGAPAGAAIDVIYSRAAASPTSNVPGAVDTSGAPAATKFNTMAEFWLSRDGTKWILRGTTTQPSAESDNILLLGGGLAGTMVLQEGRPFPGAAGAEVVDFLSGSVGHPFNAHNDWTFVVRAKGGMASVFQKILRYSSAGVGQLRFQMGDLYTGMTDNPVGNAGNETIGNSAGSVHLRDDGVIGWYDPNPGNLSTTRYPVSAYDAVRYLQSNADTVTAISGGGSIGLSGISSTGTISVFLTSPDNSTKVIRGKADVDANLSSLGDPDCVVVNGQIRVQAGQPLPGDATLTVSAINQTFVASNNDWYIRGMTATGAWAVRNGTVIAKTGGSIGAETWASTTFSTISGNSNGDWLLVGRTTNANAAIDDVLVVNGQIVLREGDPVQLDIDGDTVLDTAYVGRSSTSLSAFSANSSVGLAPDRTVYILANLRTAADGGADLAATSTPTALLRITPPASGVCCRGATCSATVAGGSCIGTGAAGASFVSAAACNAGGNATSPCCYADYNKIGSVSVTDIFAFLTDWFAASPSAIPGGDGTGTPNVSHIFSFLTAWFAGGC